MPYIQLVHSEYNWLRSLSKWLKQFNFIILWVATLVANIWQHNFVLYLFYLSLLTPDNIRVTGSSFFLTTFYQRKEKHFD